MTAPHKHRWFIDYDYLKGLQDIGAPEAMARARMCFCGMTFNEAVEKAFGDAKRRPGP